MIRWILLSLSAITAAAAPPLFHSTFEDGPGTWITMGENCAFRLTPQPADRREGHASLVFDYNIGQKAFGAAILPVKPGALNTLGEIHFWIKTDYATSTLVILSEKGGGNYSAIAWSPGGAWQEVRMAPDDFTLSEGRNDPPDPDGKLDLDQLQGIGIADLGQIFSGGVPNPDIPIVVVPHSGKHTLLINDFEALEGSAPRKDKLAIDPLDFPQLSWFSPGGATFRRDTSNDHVPGVAIEVTYTEVPDSIVYFARSLPREIPAKITHISFDIASEQPAQLLFGLQQKGNGSGEGPRYNTVVEVNGGGKPDHRDLSLSGFTLDKNGPPDPNGGLNITRAKLLSLADISTIANMAHGPNKIWITNLRLTSSR